MSITVDEFLRLKQICEPRRSLDLTITLTDELIDEAARRLPFYLVCRLEAAKNVPIEDWAKLRLPRKDGLGNITPNGVAQAVRHRPGQRQNLQLAGFSSHSGYRWASLLGSQPGRSSRRYVCCRMLRMCSGLCCPG